MNEVTKPQAFRAMSADLQISMDDVVSAFVSQYENNLFNRKKELAGEIKKLEKQLEDLTNRVSKEVTGAEYQVTMPLGLSVDVLPGKINFEKEKVLFTVHIKPKDNGGYYGNSIKLEKHKPIPKRFIKEHQGVCEGLGELRAQMSEILVNLKSVTRKERQVRGKIAIRKLEDAGYASLMADPELIQLVQLDEE